MRPEAVSSLGLSGCAIPLAKSSPECDQFHLFEALLLGGSTLFGSFVMLGQTGQANQRIYAGGQGAG